MLLLCLVAIDAAFADDDDLSRALPSSVQRASEPWRWLDDDDRADVAPSLLSCVLSDEPAPLSHAHDVLLTQSLLDSLSLEILPDPDPEPYLDDYILRGANISSLAIAPYDKRVFGYMSGGWGNQDAQGSDADRSGFSVASWGGGLGEDWNVFGHGLIGFGAQGNETKIRPHSGGRYKATLSTVAGYGRLGIFDALWRVDALFGMARNREKQRLVDSSGTNRFSTTQWLVDLEFGARFDKGYTRIEPLVNFRVLNLVEPARAEKYLKTESRPSDFSDASYRLKLGSRFSWEHEAVLATLKPYLLAAWAHEFGNRQIYTIGDNSLVPVAFRYGRARMARDRIDLGGGVDAAMRGSLDLYLKYDVEFAKEYMDYLFMAGFNKKF